MGRKRQSVREVTDSPTAILFSEIIDRHPEYPQRQLALDSGFTRSSAGCILTQIRTGRTILPLRHIKSICGNLNEDPRPLFMTAIKEYYPEIFEFLEDDNTYVLEEDEIQVLKSYRKAKEKRQDEYRKRIFNKTKKELEKRGETFDESLFDNVQTKKVDLKTQFVKNENEELVSHLKNCVHIAS